MKLPKKKDEPKNSKELYDYTQGWNSIIEDAEYLCNEYGDEYAKESLSRTKEHYKGVYDCILEIEKLNKKGRINESNIKNRRNA